MPARVHLILPVETAARELDAKLLLALFAAHGGMQVTLGNKAFINLDIAKLDPGIYLSHNFNAGRDRIIAIARDLGHRIVAWDEEGLVWINEEIYRSRRVNPSALARLDVLLLWGKEQHRAIQPMLTGNRPEVRSVGNPRADLLRPELRRIYEDRAEALRKELGDFILMNSNFGWINHALANSRAGSVQEHLVATAAKSGFPLAYLQHRHAIYQSFVELVPEIARMFPARKIIVRRHPSESPEAWVRAIGQIPNVEFRYDSDLVPWLLAAGHILQNGCTTAVETALLGRAAISFRPVVVEAHEIPQPNRVSHQAHSVADVMAMLSDPGLTDRVAPAFKTALDDMVTSRTGQLAAERIVTDLHKLVAESPVRASSMKRLKATAQATARRLEKAMLQHIPGSSSQLHYISQKFPPTPVGEIRTRLDQLAGKLNMSAPLVRQLQDRIFRIEPFNA